LLLALFSIQEKKLKSAGGFRLIKKKPSLLKQGDEHQTQSVLMGMRETAVGECFVRLVMVSNHIDSAGSRRCVRVSWRLRIHVCQKHLKGLSYKRRRRIGLPI
jgi:hypothetical protein